MTGGEAGGAVRVGYTPWTGAALRRIISDSVNVSAAVALAAAFGEVVCGVMWQLHLDDEAAL